MLPNTFPLLKIKKLAENCSYLNQFSFFDEKMTFYHCLTADNCGNAIGINCVLLTVFTAQPNRTNFILTSYFPNKFKVVFFLQMVGKVSLVLFVKLENLVQLDRLIKQL